MANGNGNGWWKPVVLAAVVPLLVAAVGYGILRSDVTHLEERVNLNAAQKANRETVAAEYAALQIQIGLLQEAIDAMRADLKEHMRP